jgi:hypothetical protein
VPQYLGWLVFNEQYMGLFLGLGLSATYILIPLKPTVSRRFRSLVRHDLRHWLG